MIPCQVSLIVEICICHAKICETVLRHKTTSKINRLPSLTSDTQEARISIQKFGFIKRVDLKVELPP